MKLWIIILWTAISLAAASMLYLSARVPVLIPGRLIGRWGGFRRFLLGLLITAAAAGIAARCLNLVNAFVCVMHAAMIWAACDLASLALKKFFRVKPAPRLAGWTALALSALALGCGWYLCHHVWRTEYELTTQKDVPELKIALIADAHLGTTFDAGGFARHLERIRAQKPDILVVAGDFVDDGTTRQDMANASKALGQAAPRHGVYFVSGNHDRSYYGAKRRGFSEQDLFDELKKNGVSVLRDESVPVASAFYLIGRRDLSTEKERHGRRASMEELVSHLDRNRYMIVLDHQPADFARQAASGVDLVLCGHTHGGQLFPFNQVGKWIGANDLVYGHEKRGDTDFIVTSGIADWAIKFKTGTKSEFVTVRIKKAR